MLFLTAGRQKSNSDRQFIAIKTVGGDVLPVAPKPGVGTITLLSDIEAIEVASDPRSFPGNKRLWFAVRE
jgi:hypothetical protein